LDAHCRSIEQVGAEASVLKRIHTGSYEQGIARHERTGNHLSSFVELDLENHVALDSFSHSLIGIYGHGFVLDEAQHSFARDVERLRRSRLSLGGVTRR